MKWKLRNVVACTALAVLTLLIYWSGLSGGYILDDHPNLLLDHRWRLDEWSGSSLVAAMHEGASSDFGRPLAMLTFAINEFFWGIEPLSFKATNLAMHVVNGWLVFLFCRRLASHVSIQSDNARTPQLGPWVVAAVWLLHPMQVSTVLYAVQRMEIGACTGVLLALIAYIRAREDHFAGKTGVAWLAGAALGMGLGLGFKETALLAPLYALLLEVFVFRFRAPRPLTRRLLGAAYASGALVGVAVFAAWVVPHYATPEAYAYRSFTLWERLATQPHVLSTYLSQIALPLPHRFPFYYDAFPVTRGWASPPASLLGFALVAGLLVLAGVTRAKRPLLGFGITLYFASHALTSNVVAFELAFEHRNYFGLLGVALACWGVAAVIAPRLTRGTGNLLILVMLAFLGGMTAIQAATWGRPLDLAMALASRAPDSPRARYDLGMTMLVSAGRDWNSPLASLALKEIEAAARDSDASPLPDQALIVLAGRRGLPVQDAAWQRLRAKLTKRRAGPEVEGALYGVINCRFTPDCRLDDAEIIETFRVVEARNPDSPVLLSMHASYALNALRDLVLAESLARRAIALAPDNPQYWSNLLAVRKAAGARPDELARLRARLHALDPTWQHFDGGAAPQPGSPSNPAGETEVPRPASDAG